MTGATCNISVAHCTAIRDGPDIQYVWIRRSRNFLDIQSKNQNKIMKKNCFPVKKDDIFFTAI